MDNPKLNDKSINNLGDYKIKMHTFGCKVNTYDTGLIKKNLLSNGFSLSQENNKKCNSNIHVLNTCAVTSEASQQAIRLIRKIKSENPFSTVVVTGCAAQVDTNLFENIKGADLVIANSHKGLLPQILDKYFKREISDRVFKSNIFKKEDLEADGGTEETHTRSFLKIQDGCNSFCSFCIIPFARGKSRSIPIHEIIKKINQLQQQNVNEVVLTGVHIGDYDSDGQKLENLVEQILIKTSINRIRLSSLEPIELTSQLIELYADKRLAPHFHMSIQSADTNVLKEMKRKYDSNQVKESLEKIEKYVPGAFVGMDVIAGFPSETDEQFENTYKLLAETTWTRLHVFPYSERQGTRAAALDQIDFAKRKERAALLRQLSLHRYQSMALKQVGTKKNILKLKSKKNDCNTGLSSDYWNVEFKSKDIIEKKSFNVGDLLDVQISDVIFEDSEIRLFGEVIYDN
jgi:threonylcarbamoyladenosine tRNA methylthiotransferase MtaB